MSELLQLVRFRRGFSAARQAQLGLHSHDRHSIAGQPGVFHVPKHLLPSFDELSAQHASLEVQRTHIRGVPSIMAEVRRQKPAALVDAFFARVAPHGHRVYAELLHRQGRHWEEHAGSSQLRYDHWLDPLTMEVASPH